MQRVIYIVTAIIGIVGFSALVVMNTPLTEESAPLLTARAVIAMAFVVIPYCTARAIEGFITRSAPIKPKHHEEILHGQVNKMAPAEATEPFFEYLFVPGAANEWESGAKAANRSESRHSHS